MSPSVSLCTRASAFCVTSCLSVKLGGGHKVELDLVPLGFERHRPAVNKQTTLYYSMLFLLTITIIMQT